MSLNDADRLCLLVHYYCDYTIPTDLNDYTTVPLSEDFTQGVYTHKYPKKQANGYQPDDQYIV